MAQLSIEQRVGKLTERVDRLEGEVHASVISKFKKFVVGLTPNDTLHIGGWVIITVCILSLLANLGYDGTFSLPASFGLIIGLWMVARESHWPRPSNSTKDLLREGLSKRRVGASTMHSPHVTRAHGKTADSLMLVSAGYLTLLFSVMVVVVAYSWLVSEYVPFGVWQLLAALLVPAIAMAYSFYGDRKALLALSVVATFLFLAFSQSPLFAVSYLTVISLTLLAYTWLTSQWDILLLTTLGSYAVLIRWAMEGGVTGLHSLVLVSSLALSLAFVLPFAGARRSIDIRHYIGGTIFASVIGFVLLPLILQGDMLGSSDWLSAAILYFVVLISLGLIGLLRHGRFSYSKYYLLSAVAVVMLISLLIGSSPLTSLTWFVMSIVLLGLGFALGSYTVRTAGLVVLALTLLYYLVNIFAFNTLIDGPILLQERIWLGGIFVLFLPVLAYWYKDLPSGEPEDGERTFIIEGLYICSFFLLFGITWVGLVPPFQTLLWCLIGAVYFVWGRYQKLPVTQAVAIAGTLTSLGKFFLVDTMDLEQGQRVIFLAILGVVGLLVSFLLLRMGHESSRIIKRNRI